MIAADLFSTKLMCLEDLTATRWLHILYECKLTRIVMEMIIDQMNILMGRLKRNCAACNVAVQAGRGVGQGGGHPRHHDVLVPHMPHQTAYPSAELDRCMGLPRLHFKLVGSEIVLTPIAHDFAIFHLRNKKVRIFCSAAPPCCQRIEPQIPMLLLVQFSVLAISDHVHTVACERGVA